jgi:hypothetical protein
MGSRRRKFNEPLQKIYSAFIGRQISALRRIAAARAQCA